MTHHYGPVSPDVTTAVDFAVTTRRSVRGFLPTEVPEQTIRDILAVASRAPSGSNLQPWKVTVLTGKMLNGLSAALHETYDACEVFPPPDPREYEYYPLTWESPYIDRRRALGWDLYGLAGIAKGEKQKMKEWFGLNYSFFDAPVGLIFTADRVLEAGSLIDYGAFIQNVMIAARGRGLDTCAQGAFTDFPKQVKSWIGAPDSEIVVCGMSLGYADPDVAVNALVTQREPVEGFARFLK